MTIDSSDGIGPVRIIWGRLAYLYAVVWSATAGYFLFHIPFEVGETGGNLARYVNAPPALRLFLDTLSIGAWPQEGFLRTFSYATSKLVFDLSGGHYFATYRSLHFAMILVLLVSMVRLVRVNSALMLGLAMLSGTAMFGMISFHEAVRETEINIKLLVPALCFAAFSLSISKPQRWKDVAAVAITFYAAFSNELGLLVWVCLAAAYLVGFRGVSRSATLAATGVLAGYFLCRFVLLDVGVPSLIERSSGFGFRMLDPPELISRFGANPIPFYAYNIFGSVLGVFFAEPRGGVFVFVRSLLDHTVHVSYVIEVGSSLLTTAVMMWFVARRWRVWFRREFDHYDRLFLVSMGVIVANAVIIYPYVKIVTMSTADMFYALAMVPALRCLMLELSTRRLAFRRGVVLCAVLAAISVGWTVRGASFFVDLTRAGGSYQRAWRALTGAPSVSVSPMDSRQAAVIEQVRQQMEALRVPSLELAPRWLDALDREH